MTDPRLILDLYGDQGDTAMPVNLRDTQGQLPWQNQVQETNSGNLMQRIQEWLGAKQPAQTGMAGDILSSRFNDSMGTSYGDYANGVVNSALGKPTLGPEVAQTRGGLFAKQLSTIADLDKTMAMAQLYRGGGTGNQTLKLAQAVMQEHPEMTLTDALALVKSSGTVPLTVKDGQIVNLPGSVPAAASMAGGKTGAEKTATEDVNRQANYTKAQSALVGFGQQAKLVTDTIDKAVGTISPWSTGYGAMLSGIPETEAGKLNNYLNTIKANIGFDKLQQMRESSPTGGALGQISDFEDKLLQAVNGALDPKQSEQLKENLLTIKKLYPQVLSEKQRAFQQDYGGYQPLGGTATPPVTQSADPLGIR
jgi:hypothetical protein